MSFLKGAFHHQGVLSMNPRILTGFLNQYLLVRHDTWNSVTGRIQSFYRDDAAIKTVACVELNLKFYNEDQSDWSDKFKSFDSYLLSVDSENTFARKEQVQQLIHQHKLKKAYIYITNPSNKLL